MPYDVMSWAGSRPSQATLNEIHVRSTPKIVRVPEALVLGQTPEMLKLLRESEVCVDWSTGGARGDKAVPRCVQSVVICKWQAITEHAWRPGTRCGHC